jgi:hypothetical protein
MLKDKVNFIKGNEAYIAHVNSLLEINKNVEDLDALEMAKSFFLYKVPYLKELKSIENQN